VCLGLKKKSATHRKDKKRGRHGKRQAQNDPESDEELVEKTKVEYHQLSLQVC